MGRRQDYLNHQRPQGKNHFKTISSIGQESSLVVEGLEEGGQNSADDLDEKLR